MDPCAGSAGTASPKQAQFHEPSRQLAMPPAPRTPADNSELPVLQATARRRIHRETRRRCNRPKESLFTSSRRASMNAAGVGLFQSDNRLSSPPDHAPPPRRRLAGRRAEPNECESVVLVLVPPSCEEMRTEAPNAAGRERQRQTLWRTVHRFFRPAPQSVCDKLVAFRSLGELDTQPGVDGLPSHFPIGLGPFQNICLMHDRGSLPLRPRHRTARCRRCRACAITESSAPRLTPSRRMMAWTRESASTSRSGGSKGCPSRATDTRNIFACSIVNLPRLASSLSRIIYAWRSRADNRADVEEIVRRSLGHDGVSQRASSS
jgi:hypothetical protein